jgi:uncharacterized repeat protein (TIGR04076 family)
MELPKIKVTIIKSILNQDLIDEFINEDYRGMTSCEKFRVGQEFIIDPNTASVPEGFCDWAWADIRNEINLIASGGNILGMKKHGIAISNCSDSFRPVYFKIERIE